MVCAHGAQILISSPLYYIIYCEKSNITLLLQKKIGYLTVIIRDIEKIYDNIYNKEVIKGFYSNDIREECEAWGSGIEMVVPATKIKC